MAKSEQSKGDSSEAKSFKDMNLEEMEADLKERTAKLVEEEEQHTKDSEESEEESVKADQTSEEDSKEDGDSESEKSDKQDADSKEESLEERFAKLEKANKELQAEFTRRSQRLKELEGQLADKEVHREPEQKSDKKESKLDALRKKNPEAAKLMEDIIEEKVSERLKTDLQPLEEKVVLRTRQDNVAAFNRKSEEFLKSELAPLEADIMTVYSENPIEWQRIIFESPDAFDLLKKEVIYRNFDKAAALKAGKGKISSQSDKKEVESATVGKKSKSTKKTIDPMDIKEFSKLSVEEMEKRLPKVEE
jgi:predicted phage tail protein